MLPARQAFSYSLFLVIITHQAHGPFLLWRRLSRSNHDCFIDSILNDGEKSPRISDSFIRGGPQCRFSAALPASSMNFVPGFESLFDAFMKPAALCLRMLW